MSRKTMQTRPKHERSKPKELEDMDLMPFGMHKDKPLQDVPASYFHWLWTSGKSHETKTCPIARYIQKNMDTLKKEHPDGIWD